MARPRRSLLSLLVSTASLVGACAPVIPIPPGTPTSEMVLSTTTPGMTLEQLKLDGRSHRAPMLSFQIPAGPHTIGVQYAVTITDQCGPEESFCTATVTTGSCSGDFVAEANSAYRLLIDSRSGRPRASVQKRSSALYVGQEESVLADLSCINSGTRNREQGVGVVNF